MDVTYGPLAPLNGDSISFNFRFNLIAQMDERAFANVEYYPV